MATLTPKQARFVDEYLVDLNATQAAIRAGYSAKTARQMGDENLSKPDIAAAVAERQQVRAEETGIDQRWVVERAVEVVERCLQHRPVRDAAGRLVMIDTPEGEVAPAYAFDPRGAMAGLTLLAKHTGGFVERAEMTGPGGGPIQMAVLTANLDKLSPEDRAAVRALSLKMVGAS